MDCSDTHSAMHMEHVGLKPATGMSPTDKLYKRLVEGGHSRQLKDEGLRWKEASIKTFKAARRKGERIKTLENNDKIRNMSYRDSPPLFLNRLPERVGF